MVAMNKYYKKKYIIFSLITLIMFLLFLLYLNNLKYKLVITNYNIKINSIVNLVKDKNPNISDSEIMAIINGNDNSKKEFFLKYGYNIDVDPIVLKSKNDYDRLSQIEVLVFITLILVLFTEFMIYNKRRSKDINEIFNYIEQINNGNYKLIIDNNTEDELSLLKNEVYKTMVKLKSNAEDSKMDKIILKDSLSNISHQIKTPLTSLLLIIDNIGDDNISESEKEKFITMARKNIISINFLIQNILKLSKFDANAIEFKKSNNNLKNVIEESLSNVEALQELKNINIDVKVKDCIINCDYNWEVEAITNILKNALEHASSNIEVLCEDRSMYNIVQVINDGDVISDNDLPNIFKRFYKSKNASSDSIGIGLSLAKSIIEYDNGTIDISTNTGKTKVTIKYYK